MNRNKRGNLDLLAAEDFKESLQGARDLRWRKGVEFIIGMILCLGAILLYLIDTYQRLDYVKVHAPTLYSWLIADN